MLSELQFPSLLAVLTAVCALFAITGGWLFLLVSRSRTKQVSIAGFGISITIDTRTVGRRRTDNNRLADASAED